jgi:DNA-binding transcriptional ArsR family regulator
LNGWPYDLVVLTVQTTLSGGISLTESVKNRKRSIEEAVSYAIAHRIRIEILCLLNEATYSASQLAELTHWPLTTISHHIKEMLNSGSIDVARIEKVRNTDQHFYRAVELPVVDDEEALALPPEVKQEYAAVVLQAIMAETLAALRAQKLNKDPRVRMMWRWYNLDEQGRDELAAEQRESWDRIGEIEARSTNRRAKSGEKPTTLIAATLGFERSRPVDSAAPAMHRLTPGRSESKENSL